ncbi:MAG: PAS domain-containing sensor histidine kinase [Myxococcota bacterium]
MRESPELFRFIEAGSLDGIWYWDLESGTDEWLSPRFKETFGYAEDEIEHTTAWWQANIHPDDLQTALANAEAHLADPSHPYDQVVRYRHKDGHTVWVRCRGIAIRDADGRPVRMLGAHQDLTALKEAEAAARRAHALLMVRHTDQQRLVHTISHDLRAPLRSMVGFADLLVEGVEDHAPEEELLRSARRIYDAGKRMQRMLNGLVALAKSSEPSPLVDLSLAALLHDVVDDRRTAFESAGATLALELPEGLRVRGVEASLRALFANLVDNALQYRQPDRPLRVRVAARRQGDTVDVSVEDNGIGMRAEDLDRVFEPFARLHTQEESPGLGMGLALAQETARAHGGALEVTSELGRGSTFHVKLSATPGGGRDGA